MSRLHFRIHAAQAEIKTVLKAKGSSKSGKVPSQMPKEVIFPEMGDDEDLFHEAAELTEEEILQKLNKK